MKPIFIAEIKTQSPFGFKSTKTFGELMDIACHYGDWVSVHTNALWGGDFEAISFVRRNTNKPILAKGLHASDDDVLRAIDHGADYVLVVDRNFGGNASYHKQVIYERNSSDFALTHNGRGIPLTALVNQENDGGVKHKYLVNSRNLSTGMQKSNYKEELDAYLKANVWVCQGSGITCPLDVNPRVNAFVVGEHLSEFVDYPTHH